MSKKLDKTKDLEQTKEFEDLALNPKNGSAKIIGGYKIARTLGAGATSVVYLGVDQATFKLVAIKQIRPECNLKTERKMFDVEASLCGKLTHPNIVSLFKAETGEVDSAYIVMEYVDGESLDNFSVPDKLLPVEKVIDVVRQAAEALNYAFSMGIVHRDVKPANMILRQDGLVKITDFGCALLYDSDTTQIGVAGSLNFIAPEQLLGKALNHQSDIYSMGAVLYRLLTGKNTFTATDYYTALNQITNVPHIPIESHRADLPKELCRIVNRALQKSLEDRYQTWSEFLSDLYAVSGIVQEESPIDEQKKFELMSQCTFFKDFLTVELWEVLRAATWRTFEHNDALIKEGEHGFSFFILLEGHVVVTKKQRLLNVVEVGDCVGENACLYKGSPIRNATVVAQGVVTALEISKERLESFSKDVCIRMDRAFLRSLNEKLGISNSRILQLMGF